MAPSMSAKRIRAELLDAIQGAQARLTAAIGEVLAAAELADTSLDEHPFSDDHAARARKVKVAATSVVQNTSEMSYLAGYIAGLGRALEEIAHESEPEDGEPPGA